MFSDRSCSSVKRDGIACLCERLRLVFVLITGRIELSRAGAGLGLGVGRLGLRGVERRGRRVVGRGRRVVRVGRGGRGRRGGRATTLKIMARSFIAIVFTVFHVAELQ